MNAKNTKLTPYIILYRDEFKTETWKQYCLILGVDETVDKITITIKDFKAEYENGSGVK